MPNYRRAAAAAAQRHGLGNWFVRQIQQESGFRPNARSSAGAQGIAQIVPKWHPDAPKMNDPIGQLDWAAKYMSGLVKKYGNPEQALSVYNSGQPDRYKDPNFAGGQTYNYVKKIMAGGDGGGAQAPMPTRGPGPSIGMPSAPTTKISLKPPPALDLAPILTESIGKIAQGWDPRDTLADLGPSLLQSWMNPGTLKVTKVPAVPGMSRQLASASAPMKPGKVGKVMAPLTTPIPGGSGFSYVDAEGAPDKKGVRHHAGLDWFAPGGTAVFSPVGGRIVEVKQSRGNSGQIFGGVVKVQDRSGRVFVFRHVNPRRVKVGQKIQPGVAIAQVTNWADNPKSSHSHVEVWKTLGGGYNYENMIDPKSIFG